MSVIEDEALSQAVQKDDVAAVQKALKAGANPNGFVPVHDHVLLGAAWNCNLDTIDALLDAGSNPIATDKQQNNVYHKIAHDVVLTDHDRANVARRFKNIGPDIDDPNQTGIAALSYAAANDLTALIHAMVVDCGADINAVDSSGNTAAHLAAAHGRGDALYTLLMLGADPENKNFDELTISAIAKNNKKEESTQAIERYAKWPQIDADTIEPDAANLRNPKLWQQAETVLESWSKRNMPLTMEMLNTADKDGRSPLHTAYLCGKLAPLMEHVQLQQSVQPEHLRDEEGKLTPLAQLMVQSDICDKLFEPVHWMNRDVSELRDVYQALPQQGRDQVQNYHQLHHQLQNPAPSIGQGR